MAFPPRPIADPTGSEAASSDHSSCGKRAAAAWIRALGGDPARLDIPDGANAQQIADGVNRLGQGFHALVQAGDPVGVAIQWLSAGRGIVCGVNCTGNAEPVPYVTDIRHWLDLYGIRGECFNDWLQTFPTYTNLSACHNPGMGNVVIWRDPQPISNEQPTTQGIPEGAQHDMLACTLNTPDGTQREYWANSGDRHVIELVHFANNPSPVRNDLTASHALSPAAGSGAAALTYDPANGQWSGWTLVYESDAGRTKAYYDRHSGTWQTSQVAGKF